MRRAARYVVLAIIAASALAAAVYAEFLLVPAPNPCAGVSVAAQVQGGSLGPAERTEGPVLAGHAQPSASKEVGGVITVVAAENFWGSLVAQIGGSHAMVSSIVTDPNTDPHEYQANSSTAILFHNAQYIIVNNVGYDSWATQLIAADGNSNQTILNIGNSLGVQAGAGIVAGNPHLWYSPAYVNQTVAWMYHNLTTIAPSLTGYFTSQYHNLTASLGSVYGEVGLIHRQFAGTKVASTESIFVYLANATGLDLVSPPQFMEAVAEGNDPSDQNVVEFQCQLESGSVRVLVYNAQTRTPLTSSMTSIAAQHNVTVMSVTETIVPSSASFQSWMGGELNNLYVALDGASLGT